jgi:hypothetical protein
MWNVYCRRHRVLAASRPGEPLTWVEIGSVAVVRAELPAIAAEIATGAFHIDARPTPLADVAAAWNDSGATQRIVIMP